MASPARPASTDPAASAKAPVYYSSVQNCVELSDWWLHRVEGGKIGVAGFTSRNKAGRIFTSSSIRTRHADGTLETADGCVVILTMGSLNISRMHQNGFPLEVCKSFHVGFPVEWEKCANANIKQTNKHSRSPVKSTSSGSLSGSTEYYIMNFLRGSYINSMGFTLPVNDFKSSDGSSGNADISPIQRHSNLSNETARFQESTGGSGCLTSETAASQELFNSGLNIPEECSEEDNQHENVHQYASGQKIDTHLVDSALINNFVDQISTDLEERATPKCGKTRVHLGSEVVLEVPEKGVSPQVGVAQCSEYSTVRRLRNGKVFGVSSGPLKRWLHEEIADISPIQRHSNLSNETARFQESTGNTGGSGYLMSETAASQELFNSGLDILEECSEEDNQHENVHKYASGQKMDTHLVDSALINNFVDQISTDMEEYATPKYGKTIVHLGSEEVLEVPEKGVTPWAGVARCSEYSSTVRRLRNGKVFGVSSGPLKERRKRLQGIK